MSLWGQNPMSISPLVRPPRAQPFAFSLGGFAALVVLIWSLLLPLPAVAAVSLHPVHLTPIATMSNRLDATAKDAEGKLESAYGELTGDTGHQIKGKAKQVQASGMHALEDVKQGAREAAENVSDAAGRLADKAK